MSGEQGDDLTLHGAGSAQRIALQSLSDATDLARASGLVVLLPSDLTRLPPDTERVLEAMVDNDRRHRRYMATYGIAGRFFFRLIGMPPSEAPRSTGSPFPGGRWPMVVDENEGVTHGLLIHPEVTVQIDAMSVERADLAVLLASIDVAATPGGA